jgi:hypothetical protein
MQPLNSVCAFLPGLQDQGKIRPTMEELRSLYELPPFLPLFISLSFFFLFFMSDTPTRPSLIYQGVSVSLFIGTQGSGKPGVGLIKLS